MKATLLAILAVAAPCAALSAQGRAADNFEITVPTSVRAEPLTGRVYVMISRTNDREPRLQTGRLGVPFFGHDVAALPPGSAAVITERDLGHPVWDMRDIPAGEYWVQGFVNVYSEFRRADGHVLWMHDDKWEGQNWTRSPGNLYSDVQRVTIDPKKGFTVRLSATHVIPPVEMPADDKWVQRFRFESPVAHEVLGATDIPRCHRAPAARLRHVHDQLPGELRAGALLAGQP